MSRVSDYSFVNAKLRARIGVMHDSHLIDEMIKAPTLVEAVAKLDGTRFAHIAEVYRSTGDMQQAELSMIEEEIATYREIASYLPDRPSGFLTVLLEKAEMDNLKNALRLWYSEVVRHHHISFRSAYVCRAVIVHRIDYDRIMNAQSYQELLRAFVGTPYHDVFARFSLDSLTEDGLFPLEIALDHLWFSHLAAAITQLAGPDRKIAEAIYTVDVDLKNILMLSRYSYYHHLTPAQLKAVMIPMGRIVEEAERRGALDSDDPMGCLRIFYGGLQADGVPCRDLCGDTGSQAAPPAKACGGQRGAEPAGNAAAPVYRLPDGRRIVDDPCRAHRHGPYQHVPGRGV